MLPFEYAFVVQVLIAILFAACAIGKRYLRRVYSRISGFKTISTDDETDIDAKLEDYFLNNRSKFEEHFDEYKTYEDKSKISRENIEDLEQEDQKNEKKDISVQKTPQKTKESVKKTQNIKKSPVIKKEIELKVKTPEKTKNVEKNIIDNEKKDDIKK